MTAADAAMVGAFRVQIGICEQAGAPFTADLLRAMQRDFEAGGDWRRLFGDWPVDPDMDVAVLRGAGAMHRLALKGVDPFKALFKRLDRDPHALDEAVRAAGRRPEIADWLKNPPQTNEVMRSAIFLGGVFEIARAQGLPLAMREMGSSGGLNLLWDRYRYRLGDMRWGPEDSAVRLEPEWNGPSPAPPPLTVASRKGVDQLPVDLADPEQRFRLLSYVWADQTERVARVKGALEQARLDPPPVERGSAANWVEREMAHLTEGCTTVLYHSYVWLYLDPQTKARIRAAVTKAGEDATATKGLAWLTFESEVDADTPWLDLTLWPGGQTRRLARAHPHGRWINWLV